MTVAEALQRGAATLRAAGVDDAALEAEILLRHALGLGRAHLFARLPDVLDPDTESRYVELIRRRAHHTPSAYLTGTREFFDLELAVAPGVLIPRPETEHVVEEVVRIGRELLAERERVTMVDVGTGSGAIALAVAKHLPALRVLATDCSAVALAMAGLNARRLRLAGRVTFLQGDLLEPISEPVDIIAANLPYIPSDVLPTLSPEVREYEPRTALDGGPDGLRLIARLLSQASRLPGTEPVIVLEIGHDQGEAVRHLAEELMAGWAVTVTRDLGGRDRVVTLRAGAGATGRGTASP